MEEAPERRPSEPEPVVPRGVRFEELMPAATGGSRRSGGGESARFRYRRRRGGSGGGATADEPTADAQAPGDSGDEGDDE
jgi:hypothetical protein